MKIRFCKSTSSARGTAASGTIGILAALPLRHLLRAMNHRSPLTPLLVCRLAGSPAARR